MPSTTDSGPGRSTPTPSAPAAWSPAPAATGTPSGVSPETSGDSRAGGSASIPRVTTSVPLLLDVDTGIDDSLALLYAAASPEADLLAVTCVSGNTDARQVAVNTLGVLELAGRSDVEVAIGREVPLERPLQTTPETHGPKGIGYAELPSPLRPVSERSGVDLILETTAARPG